MTTKNQIAHRFTNAKNVKRKKERNEIIHNNRDSYTNRQT